jgi:hypothetical protein
MLQVAAGPSIYDRSVEGDAWTDRNLAGKKNQAANLTAKEAPCRATHEPRQMTVCVIVHY